MRLFSKWQLAVAVWLWHGMAKAELVIYCPLFGTFNVNYIYILCIKISLYKMFPSIYLIIGWYDY